MSNSIEVSNPLEAFNQVTIINLDINYTPGHKKIPKDQEEHLYGGNLPPDQFITSGQGKLYPRSEIQVFDTMRVAARALCRQAGISFMNGYAIPDHRVPDLLLVLEDLREKYIKAKELFICTAEKKSLEWISQAPKEWQPVLKSCTYDKEELNRKIGFEISYFRISGTAPTDELTVSKGLVNQASSMSDQLIDEISKDALDTWIQTLSKKQECSQSTVNRIRKLLDKLYDLAWLSPKTTAIADHIKSIITSLPTKGLLKDKDFTTFRYLVLLMSDPVKFKTLADSDAMLQRDDDDEVVFSVRKNRSIQSISDQVDDSSTAEPDDEQLGIFGPSTGTVKSTKTNARGILTGMDEDDDDDIVLFGFSRASTSHSINQPLTAVSSNTAVQAAEFPVTDTF